MKGAKELDNMENRFNELYQMYSNDIYRLAFSYLLNKEDSEDVVQKVFIKLYNNKKILSLTHEDAKRWLFRVCINEAKDILKSPWRKLKAIIKDDVKDKTDKKDILIESLNNINSDYRIPLYLFYYEGYSIKEIALQMGKSESAIKMRLSRGKLALKKEMEGVK
ncbi:MAG: RNA polymerase sigma factor [Bacilli bacterium]|nr:RNA polymerase sigma factor [Bacilli bacterium]